MEKTTYLYIQTSYKRKTTMSLNGTPVDLYQKQYSDLISHELQQKGSVLRGIVTNVVGEGQSYNFSRLGSSNDASEVTTRFAPIQPAGATFERRVITPRTISKSCFVDHLDLMRGANPTSEIVRSVSMSLGRQLDKIIFSAIGGNAARELDGTLGTVAFDSNNTIAYNDTDFAAGSVSVNSLHEGKLRKAAKKLAENFVDTREEIFVILTAHQAAMLTTRLQTLGVLDTHKLGGMAPQSIPGVIEKLARYDGLTFIQYQALGDAENLTSNNEYVYMFPRSAITLAMWGDIKVDVKVDDSREGYPIRIYGMLNAGAVRVDEKKVVRMVCTLS